MHCNSVKSMTMLQINDSVNYKLPIQHSSRAQGDVFTTSGGSTPTFKHKTRATLTVFIWRKKLTFITDKATQYVQYL